MIKTLKSLALAGLLLVTTTPFISISAHAAAGDGVFASGNNSYRFDETSSTHDSSWDAALDLTNLSNPDSNVIGAKITLYTIEDYDTIESIKNTSTKEEAKSKINEYFSRSDVGAERLAK